MSPHLKAVLVILILGSLGIVAARFVLPLLEDRLQRDTSDAAAVRGTLRIGMDNWVGYFPLCSPEMARRMRQEGYAMVCEDDQANYPERFKRLARRDLQLAVATVDSYLLNAAKLDFPGTIVAVLDESKGGDAIVAQRDRLANLSAIRGRDTLRIAYTPSSPSEHLLKSISEHFDLKLFEGNAGRWQVKSDGSSDALKKLLNKEVDAAVLWEPDVSRALNEPGIGKLIGSEDTDKLIVDVLLVERRFLQENADLVGLLLKNYFDTLHHYQQQPHALRDEVTDKTRLNKGQVDAMLQGVQWTSLADNGLNWFGLVPGLQMEEGLIDTINTVVSVLRANGDFSNNPLPDRDPYRITNRQFIATLFAQQSGAQTGADAAKGDPLSRPFSPLDDAGWQRLREIGNLKVEPVSFRRGAGMLDLDGKQVLDRMAEKLRHYPNFRVLIKGHSDVKGDPQANLDLSSERASAVARYLTVTYGVDQNRVRALGYGGSQPLPKLEGESDRTYSYRLPRVEVTLVTEGY
jgi:outer membrane protein OmpA-like peptidoglycan-associated protein/ABC-type nitrate/sulfonate/bicarbonate transport system substrate-binding protein